MDQATSLRKIVEKKGIASKKNSFTRVITITSGKGGVGKTNIVANLAIALSKMNKQVLILDADLGLANIDVILGITPKYNMMHLINDEKTIEEIIVTGPNGILILPAASGIENLANLCDEAKLTLSEKLAPLWKKIDYLIIDTGAGISPNVIYFNLAAQETIVVVTPEPTSITDAYALMKILSKNYHQHRFSLIVNMVKTEQEAREIFQHLTTVTDKFLEVAVDFCGYLIEDRNLTNAVRNQKPFIEMFPTSDASCCIKDIAKTIDENHGEMPPTSSGIGFFWQQMIAGV